MAKKKEESERLRVSTELVVKQLRNKEEGCLVKAGEYPDVERLPTGLAKLDYITGGGFPLGRLTQVAGPDKAGKTTIIYQLIANAQLLYPDEYVLFVDAEGTFDKERAVVFGVNLDKLYICPPDNAEQAFRVITKWLSTNCKLIVVDSIPMLFPEKVMVNDVGEIEVAPIARFLTLELPKLLPHLRCSGTALVFINQIREKVGGMGGWGDNTQLPGGRMLRHFSSLICKAQRRSAIKKSDEEVGQEIKIKVTDSKICPKNGECLVNLVYPFGFIEDKDLEQAKTEARKLSLAKAKAAGAEVESSDESDD